MARYPLTPFRSGSLLGGDPFLSLHREMNRLFDDVLRGGLPAGTNATDQGTMLVPQMNVSETENEIRITAELPGVKENDVEVTLDDDVLTVRGEKKLDRKEDRENFHFVERSFGTFQRALRLPMPVDPQQVQARFEHGVLTITLPKTKAQDRSRKIEVQGAARSRQGAEQGGSGSGPSSSRGGSGA